MSNDNEQDKAIVKLETNYQNMSEKIDKLEKTVVKGFDDIKSEFKCFRNEADKKYASKLTEKIVYSMAGVLLLGIVYAFIGLVIK
jgi:hypothetical protein